MTEELFDLSEEYEAMLNQGIRLSGENMFFFLEGRLGALAAQLRSAPSILQVLDFGCGLGYASKRLREMFPGAQVTGVDTSEKALTAARERNGQPGIRFLNMIDLREDGARYDLCYVNGVFHHIPPDERPGSLRLIHSLLSPGGQLALFENNPWNVGARLVMARIPFDRNAQMLSPLQASDLLQDSGFEVARIDSMFFFPRVLKPLRPIEPWLGWTRLGAQYLALGVKR